MATVNDHLAGTNIKPFPGDCLTTKTPCRPVTPDQWTGGESSVLLLSLVPILSKTSTLKCTEGCGEIRISDPGQSTLEVNPPHELSNKDDGWVPDFVHSGLDALGFVPGAGAIPDAINATLYATEGDWDNALWSAGGAVPLAGDAAKGTKGARQIIRNAGPKADEVAQPFPRGHLPVRDVKGKVHGRLPQAEELGEHSVEDLIHLREELKESVKERMRKTEELGSDRGHGQRQASEQELIRQIDSHLKGRS